MIKMEQKRRIKGVNEKYAKKVKGKAIIGIAMAAVMLASVFAATVPMASAESRGDNFNHIVVQQAPQKVLIGQNLQFEGFDGTVTISRLVSGDVENVYQADEENKIYNVNWPASGAYYVNYVIGIPTTYDAQLSVEKPDMPLELKVGTRKVSTLAVGTDLIIDTGGMNLFGYDQVDLVVIGPDGQIKHDEMNNQHFTDITVSYLVANYGSAANTLKTSGGTIGDYTFQVRTDQENACGLKAQSSVKPLKIIKGEITIEADTTSAVELETVKLIVTGVAGDVIHVAASPLCKYVLFKEGIYDTPTGPDYHEYCFTDTIGADGIRTYAVEFNDSGTFTIKVTVVSGPRAYDSDTVDITVSEKLVTFDVPPTVTIGENFTIRGTANIGSIVDIAVDEYVYPLLNDLLINDNGDFSVDIATAEIAPFTDPGPVRLTAYIDRAAGAGDAFEASDGTAKLFMLKDAGDGIDISASETSVGKNETIILAISAVPNHNVSVTTSDPAHTAFEYNRYDFTGTSSNIINIAPADTISIPADVGDCDSHTEAKDINGVWNTMDATGILKFAVHFKDLGTYKITATDYGTGHPTATRLDAESLNITVSKKNVTFDLPPIAIIGDKITIRGTATSGTYISVFLDDYLDSQLWNLVIEDGEFSKEVRTTDIGMWRFGIAELKAYIDCDKRPGEDRPSRSPDGVTKVFMVSPWLTASLSTDSVDQEGNFIVYGIAPGSTEVTLLSVPPRGGVGKSLLDKGETGLSPRKASVSRTDNTYTKKMTVQEDATTGYYDEYVLTPGMDNTWGMTGERDIKLAFHAKYGITDISGPSIATKTQAEIQDILEDMVYAPGSDDLMVKLRLKVETPYVWLHPIPDVTAPAPLVVAGTSNRKDGYTIVTTCISATTELAPQTVYVENATFSATFDTTDAVTGEYTVKADDGDGHVAVSSVNIIVETPAPP